MNDNPPRIFGYARASTDKQENSPHCQKDKIQDYIAARKLEGDVRFYVDAATSGKIPIDKRAAGNELFKTLRRGDHLIITKIDRAFRSTADCATKIDLMHRMGVRLHIVDFMGDSVDIGTPQGRMFIHIVAAFAEYERELISQRTKEGLAFRKKRGVCHTHFPGYGFRWEKRWVDGKYSKIKVRDDEERAVMKAILQWRIGDPPLSWDEISQHLRYNLKLIGKGDTEWDVNRVRRAASAELALQKQERIGNH